nr:MAG TPA: hypothetical protein [Caudoviricetes sp.]
MLRLAPVASRACGCVRVCVWRRSVALPNRRSMT